MLKFLIKSIISLAVVIFIGLIIIPVSFLLIIDPNNYKQDIEQFIEQKTDQKVAIRGDIKLAFWPYPAIEVNDLSLGQPLEFKSLTKQDFISIKKLALNLPLQDLIKGKFAINNLLIDGGQVFLVKNSANKYNFESFVEQNPNKNFRKTHYIPSSDHFLQNSSLNNKLEFVINQLKLVDLNILFASNPKLPFTINSIATFNQDGINISNSLVKFNDQVLNIDGLIRYPVSELNLKSDKLIINKLINNLPKELVPEPIEINDQNLEVLNLKAKINQKSEKINFQINQAKVYQGDLKLAGNISNKVSLKGSLNNANLQNLLANNYKINNLLGNLDVDFDLITQNNTQNKSFAGPIKFKVNNGQMHGIDLKYLFDVTNSLIKKQPIEEKDTKITHFDSLTGTIFANNNILANQDLKLVAGKFQANGSGAINLNNQTIDYYLYAFKVIQPELPLAIKIKGPLDNPKIEPDFNLYLKKIIGNKIETEIEQKIDKKLEKELDKNLNKIFNKLFN